MHILLHINVYILLCNKYFKIYTIVFQKKTIHNSDIYNHVYICIVQKSNVALQSGTKFVSIKHGTYTLKHLPFENN